MAAITGSHVMLYSRDADADRDFLRDVLQLPHVDAGHGWLIFQLPPSELGVHPTEGPGSHELYLMCDDIDAFVGLMARRQVPCTGIVQAGWGRAVRITLPGGGELGVYQPRHARPG